MRSNLSGSYASYIMRTEAGFSLIELLVALAVFSIAALTLLESQGSSARAASTVKMQTLASLVADNRVAMFTGSIAVPAPGQSSGNSEQLGTTFTWRENRQIVQGTSLMRLTVSVLDPDNQERVVITAFRRVN